MCEAQRKTKPLGAVTAAHDFEQISYQGERLFSVREGVPLDDAFDNLSALITASRDNICTLAEHPDVANVTGGLWASVHLLTIASELAIAMQIGHTNASRGGAKP